MLVYAPDTAYEPACLANYDNWTQVRTQDGYVRWEGGMAGKGYVELHNFGGGFYLEEAYLPT